MGETKTLPLATRIASEIAQQIKDDGEIDERWMADWIEQEAILPLLEALKAAQQEFLGLSSYLATCDPVTIMQNLAPVITSLNRKRELAEAAIRKAEEGS